jgi:hypothetical protein
MLHILRVVLAFTVSLFCVAGHAGQIYTYSYTFGSGDVVTGSFHGTGDIHLVTGLSQITALVNGAPLNGSGNLFGVGQDGANFVAGGAVASDQLDLNRFFFVDSNFPSDTAYSSYFAILDGDPPASVYDGFLTYAADDQLVAARWSLTLVGDDGEPAGVPEPASLVLVSAGIAAIAATRRKRARASAGK